MCDDECAVDKLEVKPADWESEEAWEELTTLWAHTELVFVLGSMTSMTFVEQLVACVHVIAMLEEQQMQWLG